MSKREMSHEPVVLTLDNGKIVDGNSKVVQVPTDLPLWARAHLQVQARQGFGGLPQHPIARAPVLDSERREEKPYSYEDESE